MSLYAFTAILAVLGSATRTVATGLCNTYEARCPLQLGVPLDQEFTSRTGQALYFQVTVCLPPSPTIFFSDVAKSNDFIAPIAA